MATCWCPSFVVEAGRFLTVPAIDEQERQGRRPRSGDHGRTTDDRHHRVLQSGIVDRRAEEREACPSCRSAGRRRRDRDVPNRPDSPPSHGDDRPRRGPCSTVPRRRRARSSTGRSTNRPPASAAPGGASAAAIAAVHNASPSSAGMNPLVATGDLAALAREAVPRKRWSPGVPMDDRVGFGPHGRLEVRADRVRQRGQERPAGPRRTGCRRCRRSPVPASVRWSSTPSRGLGPAGPGCTEPSCPRAIRCPSMDAATIAGMPSTRPAVHVITSVGASPMWSARYSADAVTRSCCACSVSLSFFIEPAYTPSIVL